MVAVFPSWLVEMVVVVAAAGLAPKRLAAFPAAEVGAVVLTGAAVVVAAVVVAAVAVPVVVAGLFPKMPPVAGAVVAVVAAVDAGVVDDGAPPKRPVDTDFDATGTADVVAPPNSEGVAAVVAAGAAVTGVAPNSGLAAGVDEAAELGALPRSPPPRGFAPKRVGAAAAGVA